MKNPVLPFALSAPIIVLCVLSVLTTALPAQEMQHPTTAVLSDHVELRGPDGTKAEVTPADFKALPHKTVTVFNAHIKKQETYSGVLLTDLLAKVHAPIGEALKGQLYMTGVIAQGTDGYKVLYSIAEVDPGMHTGEVIVADTLNGAPLTTTGAFQLINTEDKRPARWVRNLTGITVVPIVPPTEAK